MNLPNISSNDFSQTPMQPPFTTHKCPHNSQSWLASTVLSPPPYGSGDQFFWGGWEKMICFETGKGRMFFLLEGAIVFFWSPGNSDQENLFYPNWFRLKWWIVCLPSFVTKVFGCTNWRSTPGRFDPTETSDSHDFRREQARVPTWWADFFFQVKNWWVDFSNFSK